MLNKASIVKILMLKKYQKLRIEHLKAESNFRKESSSEEAKENLHKFYDYFLNKLYLYLKQDFFFETPLDSLEETISIPLQLSPEQEPEIRYIISIAKDLKKFLRDKVDKIK